nr:LptA/OstA family protein [Veillonella denticariosi]
MRKSKVQWLAAACLVCLAQPVWAATDSTPPVYQDTLDSEGQSYSGELAKASTPENSNIRVVRRGEKAKSTEPSEQLPTRIDANKMAYTGSTGDVYAEGDVVVTQGNQTLLSPRIEGNTKTTEYRTVGGYRYLEDNGKTKDITGQNMTYRTKDRHFTADQAMGWNDPYYVKGSNATFDGQEGHMEKGMVTTKHAMAFKHAPDYRVEGGKILRFIPVIK